MNKRFRTERGCRDGPRRLRGVSGGGARECTVPLALNETRLSTHALPPRQRAKRTCRWPRDCSATKSCTKARAEMHAMRSPLMDCEELRLRAADGLVLGKGPQAQCFAPATQLTWYGDRVRVKEAPGTWKHCAIVQVIPATSMALCTAEKSNGGNTVSSSSDIAGPLIIPGTLPPPAHCSCSWA